MLNRSQRISKKDISSQKLPSQFIKTPYFSVKMRKNTASLYRFAFIISKKIDKRAVVRNTLKRRFSAAAQLLEKPHHGTDVLFFLKKDSLSLTQQQIQEEVQKVVSKSRSI